MATTPEGKVKKKVSKLLKDMGAYYFMPVQAGYGSTTLDYLVCFHGEFIAIETKAPGKKMSARQELTAELIAEAGGVVFVISDDGTLAALALYLDTLRKRHEANPSYQTT